MLGRRPCRMNSTHRRLVFVAAAAFVLLYVGWDLLGGISSPSTSTATVVQTPIPTLTATPFPVATVPVAPTEAPEQPGRVSYAVALNELSGLPPSTAPGAVLQLWAAWEPPITKRPEVQKILDDVILEKIVPPVTPEGPYAVILSIPRDQRDWMVYGDRYGTLSAVVVAGT